MPSLLDQALESYIDGLLPERPAWMQEMEAYAAEHSFPIIGPQAGSFLYQWAAVQRPTRLFEMGSGFGYSACWLLAGAPDARIVCTDMSRENAERAEAWLTRAGYWDRVDFRVADALDVLQQTDQHFDLIYNDVDKEAYPEVFRRALQRLTPGGALISDNVLWSGRVAEEADQSAATRAIRAYNRLMFETPNVRSVIVPIRDGLGVTILGEGGPHAVV